MSVSNKVYNIIEYARSQTASLMTYASEKCTQGARIAKITARTFYQYAQATSIAKAASVGTVNAVIFTTITQLILAFSGEESQIAENPIQTFLISTLGCSVIVLTKYLALSKINENINLPDHLLPIKKYFDFAKCRLILETHLTIALGMSALGRVLLSPLIGELTARRMAMISAFMNTTDNIFYIRPERPESAERITLVFNMVIVPLFSAAVANHINPYHIATAGTIVLGTGYFMHKEFPNKAITPSFSKKAMLLRGILYSTVTGTTTAIGRNFFSACALQTALITLPLICVVHVNKCNSSPSSFMELWHKNASKRD